MPAKNIRWGAWFMAMLLGLGGTAAQAEVPHREMWLGGLAGALAAGPAGAVLGLALGEAVSGQVVRAGSIGPVEVVVPFRTDSSAVPEHLKASIEAFAGWLLARPEARLALHGHADNRGDADYNQRLSLRRVEAVRQLLLKAGLSRSRLEGHGWGEERGTDSGDDADGWAMDRRVVMRLSQP